VCVCVCWGGWGALETSTVRWPVPELGCCAPEKVDL
jgi:hypothetical protein